MEIDGELLKEHIPHYIKNLEDIENLPKEKREPIIKALRDIIKQIE